MVTHALQCSPGSADAYDALAHVSMLLGKHERANLLYRRVVKLAPDDARFWYNLASSERSFGRLQEAESACNRAIALDSSHYASYLLRSELRVQSAENNHLGELQSALSRPGLDERARVPLGYALAKELDDLQRYSEAFRYFQESAQIRRRHLSYSIAMDEHKIARIQQIFTPDLIQRRARPEGSSRFIFIVGLPRSGTTLLEHILSGLERVRSNGETDYFARALFAAAPAGPQDVFARAALADPGRVAASYGHFADHDSNGTRIIEKLPLNYLYLGAIHRALPQAKLVLVRRSPIDACFAMYRTLFGVGYPFSYDFEDLARYHAAYDQLLEHWRKTLKEELCEVVYEELVSDPLQTGARVAQHCGLTWNPRAIEVEKSATISMTASAAQVRRPIYGSSSGRWRHYIQHLGPLLEALRRHRVISADSV